jgi:superfamily I DNA/RNA helicase
MPGENITFPSYTILPSGERIYSCTDAQIKTAEIVEINKLFKEIDYLTPIKQLPRSLSISLQGQFQKLIIVTSRFPAELEVFVPLIGNRDMQEQRSQIRRKLTELANNDIIGSDCLVCAWDAMRQLNSYFPTIYSANVMTVHKSQGSSFDHVFVHKDVEECKADYSNALLYVAATRAKKGLYFLNP